MLRTFFLCLIRIRNLLISQCGKINDCHILVFF
nr:MAG TPA: hypothetical protein [Caudoviricetes sp.]